MKYLIIIPHYGKDEYLDELLPTLGCEKISHDLLAKEEVITLPFKYGEIFIWNNNKKNVGFTKANNHGILYGLSNGYDVFWLLNNDTKVQDLHAAILVMDNEFKDGSNTGVVGHKILSMDDPDFIHHGGTGEPIPAGIHKVGRVSQGGLNERTLERWVTGASFAISSMCATYIGLMDESMRNYYSDSDYCYRARAAGFNVVYLPIAILHHIGQSAHPSAQQERILKEDMLAFYSKWLTGRLFADLNLENLT